jgi:hypothetical protein
VGVSDGITVVKSASDFAEVKAMAVGTGFVVADNNIAATADQLVFVEDTRRLGGLKLRWSGMPPGLTWRVDVAGIYRGFIDNEPTADALSITAMGTGTARPFGLTNRSVGWSGGGNPPSVGPDNRCLLIRIWGRVSYVGAGFFLLDDGSGVEDYRAETGQNGLKVTLPFGAVMPNSGSFVTVIGVSRATDDGRRWIMPRTASDIITIQ